MQLVIRVEKESANIRIDKFLRTYLDSNGQKGYSRSTIQKYINDGSITVNSLNVQPDYIVKFDDKIDINVTQTPDFSELKPQNIRLNIVFEDNDIIVVNKPSGMVVHPAHGNPDGTLVNALIFHCNQLASLGLPHRPSIVHRLDKDTSGLMVCAKTNEAFLNLIEQFKTKQIRKEYIAIVKGSVKSDYCKLDMPIGRHSKQRQNMAVSFLESKEAITEYRVLFRCDDFSVLKVRIHTGRTHQIRVHMAYIGHPVLGDTKYGRKSDYIDRQALHAWRLEFVHPITKKKVQFKAGIPEDMKNVFTEFGFDKGYICSLFV